MHWNGLKGRNKYMELSHPNIAGAKVFSPDFPDEIQLDFSSGRIVVPQEFIKIYSVISLRTE